jgi:hypothetical protein
MNQPDVTRQEEDGVEYTDRVFCPFARNGECTGGCPSNRERACVNGEDD